MRIFGLHISRHAAAEEAEVVRLKTLEGLRDGIREMAREEVARAVVGAASALDELKSAPAASPAPQAFSGSPPQAATVSAVCGIGLAPSVPGANWEAGPPITAGEVWRQYGLPTPPSDAGSALRPVLMAHGCCIGRRSHGDQAWLFDRKKVKAAMDGGVLDLCRRYYTEARRLNDVRVGGV